MHITFHGHSCIQLHGTDHNVIIDPYLTGNPQATVQADDIKTDYVLLTHGHGDHIADAAAIAISNDAPLAAIVELADYMALQGVKNTVGMNLGGGASLAFGNVKFVPALHSSSLTVDGQTIYMGNPAGLVIQMDGLTIYHAGDTALFSDMKLIGERYQPDLSFLPIGSFFTMDPEDALFAAQWTKSKHVVPIHYNTFPPIVQDGRDYVERLQGMGIHGIYMEPDQVLNTEQWSVQE